MVIRPPPPCQPTRRQVRDSPRPRAFGPVPHLARTRPHLACDVIAVAPRRRVVAKQPHIVAPASRRASERLDGLDPCRLTALLGALPAYGRVGHSRRACRRPRRRAVARTAGRLLPNRETHKHRLSFRLCTFSFTNAKSKAVTSLLSSLLQLQLLFF